MYLVFYLTMNTAGVCFVAECWSVGRGRKAVDKGIGICSVSLYSSVLKAINPDDGTSIYCFTKTLLFPFLVEDTLHMLCSDCEHRQCSRPHRPERKLAPPLHCGFSFFTLNCCMLRWYSRSFLSLLLLWLHTPTEFIRQKLDLQYCVSGRWWSL